VASFVAELASCLSPAVVFHEFGFPRPGFATGAGNSRLACYTAAQQRRFFSFDDWQTLDLDRANHAPPAAWQRDVGTYGTPTKRPPAS